MTIQSTVNDGITYSGNDSATTFAFPFKVDLNTQIEVIIRDALGVETTAVLNTDYTVAGFTVEGSGVVTYPISGDPLATGKKITIKPKMDFLQSTDIRNQGRFAPEIHENAFDTLMMHIKELKGEINRTIQFKKSSEITNAEFGDDPVDSRILAWNGTSGLIKNVAPADIDKALVSSVWEAIIDDTDLKALINGLTAITTLENADQLTIADNSDSDNNKKITFANFKTEIAKLMVNALTAITTLQDTDQIAIADNSDSDYSKKITFANFKSQLPIGKNLIINGDFKIAQRGTSFAAATHLQYTLDRFLYGKSGAAVHTISQDTDTPTVAEAGRYISNSMKIDCTTADTSVAAGDVIFIGQHIEGYNFRALAQKEFTISFWIKATKIGVYCVSVMNSGTDRAYISEVTVNSSDTWEKKTITISASPSAGTWDYTNGIGLRFALTLYAGSTYQTTADAWQTGNYFATSNQVNACDSTSNNVWIADLQIEAGSVASDFENRSIQNELILCQRYYEKSYNIDVNPGTITEAGKISERTAGGNIDIEVPFLVFKRAAPTVTHYNPVTGTATYARNYSASNNTLLGAFNASHRNYEISKGALTDNHKIGWHFTAEAEL